MLVLRLFFAIFLSGLTSWTSTTRPLHSDDRVFLLSPFEILVGAPPFVFPEVAGSELYPPKTGFFDQRRSFNNNIADRFQNRTLQHQSPSNCLLFSRMRSEGSRFVWGPGGEAVFAENCLGVRNRSHPSATVCVSAVRLSTAASASGVVLKVCEFDPLSSQLFWCL